ncbi:MAG: thioesterase family protein [Pseudomonadota bacterium]|nr:thioesterase family protein [Pseudomonadota bacterium]
MTIHTYDIAISPDDIDHMGHVNNAVYVRWVQDVIIRHWQRFAGPEAVASRLWVALKHEINYREPAFLEDHLQAGVILERISGVRAQFRTLFRRGEKTLADVVSCWWAVDASTHRPARLTRDTLSRIRATA